LHKSRLTGCRWLGTEAAEAACRRRRGRGATAAACEAAGRRGRRTLSSERKGHAFVFCVLVSFFAWSVGAAACCEKT
jgi:hypothetical protein